MEGSSEDRNGKRNIQSQKRQRHEVWLDLDVLACPICYEPLAIPVFQCDKGHVACHFCWAKLKKKCSECALPTGNRRCRAMESVLKSITVPCRYADLGCTKIVPYERESNHEKECCLYSLCSCPVINECNYKASYKDTFFHYLGSLHRFKEYCFFSLGEPKNVQMPIKDKMLVLITLDEVVLFVVQCFREPNGVYVAVNCIAPLAPELKKFSYRISYYFDGGRTCRHESPEMKRIRQVNFLTPQDKNYMFVPNSLLTGEVLEMELCISEVKS